MALKNLSRSIEGCVAVITGAGSGMGAATAKLFAEEGATVALIDSNEPGVFWRLRKRLLTQESQDQHGSQILDPRER